MTESAAKVALQAHRMPTYRSIRTETGTDGKEHPVAWEVTCRCGVVTTDYESHLVEAIAVAAQVAALQDVADAIERELICCDVYDGKGVYWRKHDICYWAGASRQIVLSKIKELTEGS